MSGINPTKADYAAYLDKAEKQYDKVPFAGTEFAARRIAADVGLRPEVKQQLAADLAARIEDR